MSELDKAIFEGTSTTKNKVLIARKNNILFIKVVGISDLLNWDYFLPFSNEFSYCWKTTNYSNPNSPFSYKLCRLYKLLDKNRIIALPLGFWYRLKQFFDKYKIPFNFNCQHLHEEFPDRFQLDWETVYKTFSFRPGQQKCLEILTKIDCGIVNAATGWGKTEVIAMICLLYSRSVICIVVKSVSLAVQIRERLKKYFPVVGQIGGGCFEWSRVNVVVINSLHYVINEKQVDIVIGDEVDLLAGPSYVEKLHQIQNAKMFGFSASVNVRADNRDKEIEAIFGPVVFTLSYEEVKQLGNITNINVIFYRIDTPSKNYYKVLERIKSISLARRSSKWFATIQKEKFLIWSDPDRNQKISEILKIIDEIDKEKRLQVLVICKTLVHCINLGLFLPDYYICFSGKNEEAADKLIVKHFDNLKDRLVRNKKDLVRLQELFAKGEVKRAISTYVWSTGVDFRNLNIVVRADAATSEQKNIQIPGRTCRRTESKRDSLVIDIFDAWDTTFLHRSQQRLKSYKNQNWNVIQVSDHKSLRDNILQYLELLENQQASAD